MRLPNLYHVARHVLAIPHLACDVEWSFSAWKAVRTGGASPRSRYATPPPLRAKGQWLLAIHRVAPKAPENFVPFAGDPPECRGDVAFPPSFGPQPSGAIEETGTIFESTLCCVEHHGDP